MTKEEALKILNEILQESERLYFSNNRGAYESGRIDGVKWCIQKISGGWK